MSESINVENFFSTAGSRQQYKPIVSAIELRNRKKDIDNALFKIFCKKKQFESFFYLSVLM